MCSSGFRWYSPCGLFLRNGPVDRFQCLDTAFDKAGVDARGLQAVDHTVTDTAAAHAVDEDLAIGGYGADPVIDGGRIFPVRAGDGIARCAVIVCATDVQDGGCAGLQVGKFFRVTERCMGCPRAAAYICEYRWLI